MRPCIAILGPSRFAELVANVRQAAQAFEDDEDRYHLAGIVAVGHRLVHAQYGWTKDARAYSASLALAAADEAERMDAAEAA